MSVNFVSNYEIIIQAGNLRLTLRKNATSKITIVIAPTFLSTYILKKKTNVSVKS